MVRETSYPLYTEGTVLELPDPYEKWKSARQRILFLVAIPALLPPISQTMYLPTINEVISDLHTSEEWVAWTLSIFSLGNAIFPMLWGPLSDRNGRRTVLLISLSIFLVANAFSACAWSVYALIFGRLLQSMALSATGVVGAGSLADVYPPAIRGNALGWYSATVLMGTVLGPILGGVVGQFLGWRAIFWSLGVGSTVLLAMIFFFLPETLNTSGPQRSANPVHTLKFFLHMPLLILIVLGGAMGGCMLLILFIYPIELAKLYSMNELQLGLAYLPFGFGTVLGTLVGGKAADIGFQTYGLGGRLIPPFIGACGMIAGLFLFAWTIEASLWYCMCALFVVGFSLTIMRPGFTSFGIEQRPHAAASVQACFYSFHSLCGFLCLTGGPWVIEHTSIKWTFTVYSISIVAFSMPMVYLMCSWMGTRKVEDHKSFPTVEPEAAPLKQVHVER